ncbi:hypothetical protein GGI07_001550 [Coemansia sp. Benny D115]|nr:hypothetical protein GGI07_001550 [Coemansia sp. Benny D115]
MSRHRAVRNLDLEEEFYDEEDGNDYDELQDISEEEQAKLQQGVKSVKDALGPNTGIDDREIKESLWYYYFDSAATIAWLRKTHNLKPKRGMPSLKSLAASSSTANANNGPGGLRGLSLGSLKSSSAAPLPNKPESGSVSVVGKALAALKINSGAGAGAGVVAAADSGGGGQNKGLGSLQGLSLNLRKPASANAQQTESASKPILKNFAASRPFPTLMSHGTTTKSTSAMPGSRGGTGSMGLSKKQPSAILPVVSSAQPSVLGSFILDGTLSASKCVYTASQTGSDQESMSAAAASAGSVMDGLWHELQGMVNTNPLASAEHKDDKPLPKSAKRRDKIPDNLAFIRMLVANDKPCANVKKQFAFDTPSPDDRVFAAQRGAAGAQALPSSKTPASGAAKAAAGSKPSSAASTPPLSARAANIASVSKDVSQLKISSNAGSRAQSQQASPMHTSGATTPIAAHANDGIATPSKLKKRLDVVAEYAKYQKERDMLNLVVVGHVDAGKSTLMGHLLYALGQVNERTMRKFERDSEKIGKGSFAFAWVLDETEEERSRGVTMDIATSSFSTTHRRFTLLDAPGHRDFVPNMISGASRADVAVLVVNAATGEFESGFDGDGQTREHAILIRSLGVRQLVVAVNKLDMVGWSQPRYLEIQERLLAFLLSCGYLKDDVRFVPVSGLQGINLVKPINKEDAATEGLAQWYTQVQGDGSQGPGPCLVDLLDTFSMPERPINKPLRLAVTDFFKGGAFGSSGSVSVVGRIAQGHVQIGEQVVLVPGGSTGVVKAIDVDYMSQEWAVAGDSVILMIQDIDIQQCSVGSVVCAAPPSKPIQAVLKFDAQLVVFDPQVPITNGFKTLMHMQSLNVPVVIHRIIETFDQRTGEVLKKKPRHIRKGATARVEIHAESPVCLELFKDSKELGRVMLRKNGETIAAGIVTKMR